MTFIKKFTTHLVIVTLLIGNSIFSEMVLATPKTQDNLPQLLKQVWSRLDTVYANPKKSCKQELTWLSNEGLRGFYCRVKSQLSYKDLQSHLDFSIFVKGPHSKVALNLNDRYDFGHYNKKFVQWLANHAILGVDNPKLRKQLQPLFDRYLRRQARVYFLAYQYKLDNAALFAEVQRDYLRHMQKQTLPALYLQEKFRSFADNMEKQGYSWYEANTAAGFWLRRSVDKTAGLFFTALQTLLTTYDADFVFKHRHLN